MAQHRGLTGQSIALVAVFAGLIAASTLVPEVTLLGGVPLTLQTFAIVLAGLLLGPWRALAAVSLYLMLGLVGAPIFANGAAGLVVLTGPTGGYLIGFVLAATVIGALAQILARRGVLARRGPATASLIAVGLVSIPIVYAVGVPWLVWRTGMPMLPTGCSEALLDCVSGVTVGVLPFLPGDILKVVAAGIVAAAIHRAYPGLLGSARRASSRAADPEDEAARATA
ncbi:biotin transporter BioY [Demequina rhizosphaerae]|uniref:biotin transporter BioY n=1 Tax=Demequina rhizosphaerae TaxID=1638985 RepID=UPI00078670ED|nr:biotin transporter BioY [Demequina rhizosphaerae]